jgi:hypothetical protein
MNTYDDKDDKGVSEHIMSTTTISSEDGRYDIIHNNDYTGYAHLVEYQGFAPRTVVSRTSIPFELLAKLMDGMLFSVPEGSTIMKEPSKQSLNT